MPHARATVALGLSLPATEGLAVEPDQDPFQAWTLLLHRLRALLAGLALSREQIGRVAWQAKSRRYSAGDVIVKEGVRGAFWALLIRGQVGAYAHVSQWPAGRLFPHRQSALLQPGSELGESMLLQDEGSPYTFRALSEVELYVLRRADVLAVIGERRLPPIPRTHDRRGLWMLVGLVLAALMAVAIWLAAGAMDKHTAERNGTVASALFNLADQDVRIVFPRDGGVLQSGKPTEVQAVVPVTGVEQIDLLVDGKVTVMRAASGQGTGAGTVKWAWNTSDTGSHTLAIQAQGADGRWVSSKPVTVTVVPGGRLAFSSNRNGFDAVYAVNTDGSGVRLLTTGPGGSRQPAVRADGALAVVSEENGGGSRIRWLPAGSAEALELFAGRDPAWSPTGDRLAYAQSVDGVSQVFIAQVEDWQAAAVTAEAVYAGQPAWSPDGTRLAYVAEREGNLDIWVTDMQDGAPLRLTDNVATDWAPAWSPDGSRLAFVSDRTGHYQVYLMRAEVGAVPQQVTEFPPGAESPAWSPDGYWLAVVAYTGDGSGINAREIYLVRADGREVVRLTANRYDDTHPVWGRP